MDSRWQVIADSWKRQTLLNVVRLRYADAPMFLDVASVINSHTVGGSGSAGGNAAPAGPARTCFQSVDRESGLDARRVTYQPLLGDRFTKSLNRAGG